MNNAENFFNFFTNLKIDQKLPGGISVLNPYASKEVLDINKLFYEKYYSDNEPRILLLGINPGRFGAGITGISFTDPIALQNNLDIANTFNKKPELSATFIHEVITAYGGPELFFKKFLISAVSPLGFVKDGININYYDLKQLQVSLKAFISDCLTQQFILTHKVDRCISIGQGKNIDYLKNINKELKLFNTIDALGHPRWIMQYRRKQKKEHIDNYVDVLKKI